MESVGFNMDILWWGACGIILNTAVYFVIRNIIDNIPEEDFTSEGKTGVMKWFRIIASSCWVLFFVSMVLFHGITWTATDTYDMGSDVRIEESKTYEAPTADEILKSNRDSIEKDKLEREQKIKEEKIKSSEEYEKFLRESTPN